MLKVGVAKTDITVYEPGIGLMGWCHKLNIARDVAMPLHARAFVVEDPERGTKVAYVCAEICFPDTGIRRDVLDRLARDYPQGGFAEHTLAIAATHTHSGPGGYSHHIMYNMTVPGYSRRIHDTMVDGIVDAIVRADRTRVPGTVTLQTGEIPLTERVAFNRAIGAYNRNHDVTPILGDERPADAVERRVVLLRFDDAEGRPLGVLNWFAVHGTSVHLDHNSLHPDNKGCASAAFERTGRAKLDNPGFVAAFAQGPCGDVTPNFRWAPERGFMVGEYDDDFESARYNGEIQFRHALGLFEAAPDAPPVARATTVESAILYRDFGQIEVDARYADGRPGHRTLPATVGISQFIGTDEGPAPFYKVQSLVRILNRFGGGLRETKAKVLGWLGAAGSEQARIEADALGNRFRLYEAGKGGRGRFLEGLRPMNAGIPLPGFIDPVIRHMNEIAENGGMGDEPWSPSILPTQIMMIGPLAIAVVSGEFTTVAGRRLRASLMRSLAKQGVREVVVSCYGNTYSGYVTTHEEYEVQGYEGGSTQFGRWTLAAHQTVFDQLAGRITAQDPTRHTEIGALPPRVPDDILGRRAFHPYEPSGPNPMPPTTRPIAPSVTAAG